MRQLVLDLPVEPRFGADDFLVSPSNEEAYSLLERWPDWPSPFLHLRGPDGSGKSHLAAIWADRAAVPVVAARDVTDETAARLVNEPGFVLEDIDHGRLAEQPLFHLVNIARERRLPFLFTSVAPVDRCGIDTPDLLSRLRLAPSVEIRPPDDALLKAVLVKLFVDRQLVVDTSVVDFIANRIERSLARAATIVAALDREALSRGRRITRQIAAALITEDEPDPNASEP